MDNLLFVDAIEKSTGNYLGDVSIVQDLIAGLANRSVERWSSDEPIGADDKKKKAAEERADVDATVATLLGQNEDYRPVPGWNGPGGLDRWIAKIDPRIKATDASEVVEVALRLFLTDVWSVVSDWTRPGADESDCQNAMSIVFQQWVAVFLGFDEAALLQQDESEVVEAQQEAEMSPEDVVEPARKTVLGLSGGGEPAEYAPTIHDHSDRSLWGTDDVYVYHSASRKLPLSSFADGIKPDLRGRDRPGVYFSTTERGTFRHVAPHDAMTFRVPKKFLEESFGVRPAQKNGVEFDEASGDVIVSGARKIEPHSIEVKTPRGWQPLTKEIERIAWHKKSLAAAALEEKPKKVAAYHGTDADFTEFDANRIGTSTDEGHLGKGFYFSTDPEIARGKKNRMSVELDVENPLRVKYERWGQPKQKIVRDALKLPESASAEEVSHAARAAGHDGVALDYSPVGYQHTEYLAFSPKQIRLIDKSPGGPMKKTAVFKSAEFVPLDGEEEPMEESLDFSMTKSGSLPAIAKEADEFPEGPRRTEAQAAARPSRHDVVLTHRVDGGLKGIASVWRDPDEAGEEGIPAGKYVRVRNLATAEKGHGGAMLSQVLEHAAEKNAGVYLSSLEGARGFWEKSGFKPGIGASYYLTPEDVADRAKTSTTKKSWQKGGTLPHDAWRKAESHPDYAYHATSRENLHSIAEGGLEVHAPDYGTEQSEWPDGATEHRSYFAHKPSESYHFAPAEGKPVLLRVRRDSVKLHRESTGDLYSKKPIEPHHLEVAMEDGSWHPVAPLKKSWKTPPVKVLATSPHGIEHVEGSFSNLDDDDDYVYHATTPERAAKILESGFQADKSRSMAPGFYRNYSKGKIFFSDRKGVSFWRDNVKDHLQAETDDDVPDLHVLRVPKSSIENLEHDELGTKDSRAGSYFTKGTPKIGAIAKKTWTSEDEGKHPRAKDGQFAAKGSGESGKAPKSSVVEKAKDDKSKAQLAMFFGKSIEKKSKGESKPFESKPDEKTKDSPSSSDKVEEKTTKPQDIFFKKGGSDSFGKYSSKYSSGKEPEVEKYKHADFSPTMTDLAKKHEDVAKLFDAHSGTEMGKIGEHTADVAKQFAKQMPKETLDDISSRWGSDVGKVLDHAVALHDIGKSIAIKKGNKHAQHEETEPIIRDVMAREGFSPKDIELAVAVVGHDLVGESVRQHAGEKPDNIDPWEAADELKKHADKIGMSPKDLATLTLGFFHSDAGSYPHVRSLHMEEDKSGKLSMRKPERIGPIAALAEGKDAPPKPDYKPARDKLRFLGKPDDSGDGDLVVAENHNLPIEKIDEARGRWAEGRENSKDIEIVSRLADHHAEKAPAIFRKVASKSPEHAAALVKKLTRGGYYRTPRDELLSFSTQGADAIRPDEGDREKKSSVVLELRANSDGIVRGVRMSPDGEIVPPRAQPFKVLEVKKEERDGGHHYHVVAEPLNPWELYPEGPPKKFSSSASAGSSSGGDKWKSKLIGSTEKKDDDGKK